MTWDIALDSRTGDWIFSSNVDIQGIEGEHVIQQRIMNRIRIRRGTWPLDPTDGALGSRLVQSLRLPRARVLRELPLMVEEALEPMDDIELTNITITEEGTNVVRVKLDYDIVDVGDMRPLDERASESLTFDLAV